jgi:hypothetical protein
MRRKALIVIVTALFSAAGLAGGLYWHWTTSPRYALQQMALALKTGNMADFFKYVNLKDIFDNFIKAANADLETPEDPEADEWTRLTRRLGRKYARYLLPKLFENFEAQIRGVMESYLRNLDNSQILAFAAAVTVAEIDRRGDEARVTLTDPKSKDRFHLEMRRHPENRIWQIVSVNYKDLKRVCQQHFW